LLNFLENRSPSIEFYPMAKDDPKRRCPNFSKLETLVGWKPNVSFEEGLKKTATWFSK
jgi:nucleoside-diphosphate-sugar epimerase